MLKEDKPGGAPTAVGPYQIMIFFICFLIVLADGFDTQAAAFAAPLLKTELTGGPHELGLIFSAGLFGSLIGGLLFGPISDRIGRKPLLLASLALVSLGSLATFFAYGGQTIALLRFVTGLGLGGAIPTVLALTAEFAPGARRSSIVAFVFAGFALGAVVGSVVSAVVLSDFGWRMIFLIGAIAPAVLLVLVLMAVPESVSFLQRQVGGAARLEKVMRRLGAAGREALLDPRNARPDGPRNAVAGLFSDGRALGTLIIWSICFLSLLCTYCILSWLPLLVKDAGLPLNVAVLASGALNIGSVFGNLVISQVADRRTPIGPTALAYTIGAVFVGLIGLSTGSSVLMLSVVFAAGLFTLGAQQSITSLVASYYPAWLRATGLGWSFGIGRLGGVVGPSLAGALLAANLGFSRLMFVIAGFSLASAVGILLLAVTQRKKGLRSDG